MNYTIQQLLGFSVGIGALIGLIRIKKIDQAYLPFIILLVVGLLNEIANVLCVKYIHNNAFNDNIYGLLESLLTIWFFQRQGLFEKRPLLFPFFLSLFVAAWVTIDLIILGIWKFGSYFNILYCFCLTLISIHFISRLLTKEKKGLNRSSLFLIAIGFVALFTIKIIVEIFWLYGLDSSKQFRQSVYRIHTTINLCVNLLFALAVLWIPAKRKYTLL